MLKQENISYVVAPYEADAQMTFLAVSKQVDAVITEDSDLIPFGCPRVSYQNFCILNFVHHLVKRTFFFFFLLSYTNLCCALQSLLYPDYF